MIEYTPLQAAQAEGRCVTRRAGRAKFGIWSDRGLFGLEQETRCEFASKYLRIKNLN